MLNLVHPDSGEITFFGMPLTGNEPAIKLYEGLGFKAEGIRPGYYEDNGEDALIMWR